MTCVDKKIRAPDLNGDEVDYCLVLVILGWDLNLIIIESILSLLHAFYRRNFHTIIENHQLVKNVHWVLPQFLGSLVSFYLLQWAWFLNHICPSMSSFSILIRLTKYSLFDWWFNVTSRLYYFLPFATWMKFLDLFALFLHLEWGEVPRSSEYLHLFRSMSFQYLYKVIYIFQKLYCSCRQQTLMISVFVNIGERSTAKNCRRDSFCHQ